MALRWGHVLFQGINTVYNSCLSDFVTCSSNFYTLSQWVNCSDLEYYRKIKFSEYVHQTLIYTNYEPCYTRIIVYNVAIFF